MCSSLIDNVAKALEKKLYTRQFSHRKFITCKLQTLAQSFLKKMVSQEEFNKAAEDVKNLTNTPSDNDLLELYSLYKQATVGDCNTDKPGFLDFKGKAKWEAWNNRKGTGNADAMTAYVEKVKALVQAHGLKA